MDVTTDPDKIRALLDAALAADPVRNTACTSILRGLDRADALPWLAHPRRDPLLVAGRGLSTMSVMAVPAWAERAEDGDVRELGAAIATLDPPAQGLVVPPPLAERLLSALDRAPVQHMDEGAYRLDVLRTPDVSGTAVLASTDDLDLLVAWYGDFGAEAFGRRAEDRELREMVSWGLQAAQCWLWSDDGVPRSMAVRQPAEHGCARIGPVYTPPEHRGHGYGSAVTAAATQDILDAGETACLFTDLANPTSNRIYQQLGYYPIFERTLVRFD